MHSLFSRTRTTSTPKKSHTFHPDNSYGAGSFDEFGRVPSRGPFPPTVGTPSKKDKKKAEKRPKTPAYDQDTLQDVQFPEGAFLPLCLDRPRPNGAATEHPPAKEHDYGYLSFERHVILSLEHVERLVEVVSEELETRGGVTTPFIFANSALDISSTAIRRLITTFLRTCEPRSAKEAQEADIKWRDEARFAGHHELGMCLRWALARVIRSVGGQDVRGLVSWDHYVEFRDSEAAQGYPPLHFATNFLPQLAPPLQAIIIRLLSLLTRIIANGTSSGHTPPSISPLFGPLFFGLGPATLAFHHTYIHYLRAVHAMEHIILAFIRWQDAPRLTVSSTGVPIISGSATSLGVPVRLKEWIKGYPAMLPSLEQKKPQPRKGVRTVRVVSVRRNVRMYSPDLVKSASTWAVKHPSGSTTISNSFGASKEWDRIAPATLKLAPRYSEAYKKRMDLPANFHPDVAAGGASSVSPSTSASSHLSGGSTSPISPRQDSYGIGVREGEDRFRSLTDLKWGEFESLGFNNLGTETKLQFDLTESARQERAAKRRTLNWSDFSSDGFTRMDAPLSATLQFSTPLATTISQWPSQNAEINKKLKKTQKSLPAFGWDTEPVIGSEEVIEEAFVDVFADLVYGGGWMDLERGESLDRDCNWALVEYKSLPPARSTASGTLDPRTSTTLILFEEFVPLEYRQQLALGTARRSRLPSIFSSSSKKQWKQAATLNGRPYVLGAVPVSPSYREVEFEGLLHANNSTRVITLNSKPTTRIQSGVSEVPPSPIVKKLSASPLKPSQSENQPPYQPRTPSKSDENSDSTTHSNSHNPTLPHKRSRFKLPVTPSSNRKSMLVPAEYSTVEFETRMASYSDDEQNHDLNEPESVKQKRRESRDDAWVDILVGSQGRRLGGQDAELGGAKRGGLRNRRSDPELAVKEMEEALRAVKNRRSPSPPSIMERIDRVDQDYGMDAHVKDLDVDEVETVPRRSDGSRGTGAERDDSEVHLAYEESAGHEDVSKIPIPRKVGYFDLHPERRKAIPSMVDEDPRVKLAQDDSDEEEEEDDHVRYGAPEVRPLPVPPGAPSRPSPVNPAPIIPVAPLKTSTMTSQRPDAVGLKKSNGDLSSSPAPSAVPSAVDSPNKAAISKTAALIEMYRERERGGAPASPVIPPAPIVVAPLQPSRLPVRSTSLPTTPAKPAAGLGLPASPASKLSSSPTPPEPELLEIPPIIPFEDTGRDSPGHERYRHGQPLHNVMEEDEEE